MKNLQVTAFQACTPDINVECTPLGVTVAVSNPADSTAASPVDIDVISTSGGGAVSWLFLCLAGVYYWLSGFLHWRLDVAKRR